MQHEEYLKEAPRTLDPTLTPREQLVSCLLGVAGEFVELVRLAEQSAAIPDTLAADALIGECGDVLWYLACLETLPNGIEPSEYEHLTVFDYMTDEAYNPCEEVKRFAFHDRGKEAVLEMCGAALDYVRLVLQQLKVSLEECRARNIAKLRERYPQGFVSGGGVR